MLRHFENQPGPAIVTFQRVQDIGQFAFELNVDHSAQNLGNAANIFACRIGHCHTSYIDLPDIKLPRRRR